MHDDVADGHRAVAVPGLQAGSLRPPEPAGVRASACCQDTRSPRSAVFLPLSRRPGGLQAYKAVVPVGWHEDVRDLAVHEGHEWVYVLSGVLRLRLGTHDLRLGAGEVAEFDTRTPHALSNPGREPAELLVLFGPQGERIHVTARPRS